MPAYVILFHELPEGGERGSHWDVMLEDGDCLRTWAVEAEPSASPSEEPTVEPTVPEERPCSPALFPHASADSRAQGHARVRGPVSGRWGSEYKRQAAASRLAILMVVGENAAHRAWCVQVVRASTGHDDISKNIRPKH